MSAHRRQFLIGAAATAAGGMALGFVPSDTAAAGAPTPELTPWLIIEPDDTVILRVPAPEFGNGAMTQQAAAICEELASQSEYPFQSIDRLHCL